MNLVGRMNQGTTFTCIEGNQTQVSFWKKYIKLLNSQIDQLFLQKFGQKTAQQIACLETESIYFSLRYT